MFAGKRWSELAAQVMKGCACLVCVRLGPCAAWGMQARVERDRETEREVPCMDCHTPQCMLVNGLNPCSRHAHTPCERCGQGRAEWRR